jgi:hypothetical protein
MSRSLTLNDVNEKIDKNKCLSEYSLLDIKSINKRR